MTKRFFSLIAAALVLQACGSNTSSPSANDPAAPPSQNPAPPAPGQPPTTQPESGSFFSAIDQVIDPKVTGDRLLTERFDILMSRLSVYALICDFKNTLGYSAQFSKLYNASTRLQALAEKVYGSEKAAYNRLEKQRNIESNRLSFQSPPNTCTLSQAAFVDSVSLSAQDLETQIRQTPRGAF